VFLFPSFFTDATRRWGSNATVNIKREPPFTIIRETLRSHGVRGLYAGCPALVIGNSVKAGVRFVSYDRFKQALADKDVSFLSATFYPSSSVP